MTTSNFIINRTDAYVVIPFFATAAMFFLLGTVFLFFLGEDILSHHFHPKIISTVHCLALGFGTMIIMGAIYQLLPVLGETKLYSPAMAFLSYIFLSIGTVLLLYSFWLFELSSTIILGGSLICISTYLYFWNTFKTCANNSKQHIIHMFFILSAFWLCFTCTFGLLLAINLSYSFIPKNHLDLLKLHAHAGIVGWFLQLITGTSAKLLPMFILGNSTKKYLLKISILSQNAGILLFVVFGYKQVTTWLMLICGLFILLGIITWILYLYDCFKHRIRKKMDIPMWHSLWSMISLLLACILLPWVVKYAHSQWISLYGILLFFGWISSLILGMTFKTLPFIKWNMLFKKFEEQHQVTLAKDLYNNQLLYAQQSLFILGITTISLGVIFRNALLIQVSNIIWLFVALVYSMNVGILIFAKRKS